MFSSHETLRDKVTVVTGASSGIGAEIAREFGRIGSNVLLVGRDHERLADNTNRIVEIGGKAAFLSLDLTDEHAPESVIDCALENFGSIDVIVHSAGIFLPAPFKDTTDEWLDKQWNLNVRAPFRLTRAAIDHLGPGSSVIFVSSVCGHVGFPNSSAYCTTKGGVELLVKSLTAELAPQGIRVNAVAPGNVHTSMNAHLFADAEYERQMLDATPARRIGKVQDIAPAVAFLASPAADYIHGASLVIDGGWLVS